jgi:hypothetical protein
LTPGLRLGDPVNLLDGLNPVWYGGGKSARAFAPLPHPPLITFALGQAPALGAWEPPRVTLYDSLDALVDALFDYRVIASRDNQGQRPLPASTLMLGSAPPPAAAAALGDLFGIDLARPDIGGFALLEVRRDDEEFRHDVERGGIGIRIRIDRYWTPEGRHAMARLRSAGEKIDPDGKRRAFVTPRQTPRYLDYFYHYGTHFVARVGLGQRLFQVLACRADRYRFLAEFWRREAGDMPAIGPLAISFIPFIGPDWICARGTVAGVGDDPELARSLQEGSWRSDGPDGADILLAPFAKSPRAAAALLDRFHSSAATRVELMSQGYLMGEARVQAWQQVLNGALLQRYGVAAGQVPQIAGGGSCGRLFGPNPRRPAFEDGRVTLLRDCLEANDFSAASGPEAREVQAVGLCLALSGRSPIDLPGQRTTLLAFRTETGGMGAKVPVLRVADEGFSRFELSTGDMRGSVVVTDRSETQRETYSRGLRFGSDASGRVIAKGDPGQPSDALLRDVRGLLECTVDMTEALLAIADADPAQAASVARGHLEWVAAIVGNSGLTAADEPDAPGWRALRARALCSARLGVSGAATAATDPEAVRALIALAGQVWELGQHPACDRGTARRDDAVAVEQLAERLREAAEAFTSYPDPAGSGLSTNSDWLRGVIEQVAAAQQMVCETGAVVLASLDRWDPGTANRKDTRLALEGLMKAVCPAKSRHEPCLQGDRDDPAWADAAGPLAEMRQGIAAIAILGQWLDCIEEDLAVRTDEMLEALSAPVRWPSDQTCQALIDSLIGDAITMRPDPALPSLETALERLRRAAAGALALLADEVQRRLRDKRRPASTAALALSPHPVLRLHAHYWRLTRLLAPASRLVRPKGVTRPHQPRTDAGPRLSLMEVAHALLAKVA